MFLETYFQMCCRRLTLEVGNLEIYLHPVEYVHMDETDHLGDCNCLTPASGFPQEETFVFQMLLKAQICFLEIYSEKLLYVSNLEINQFDDI